MLKNLFNLHEESTYRRLKPVCQKHGASVYPKVRVADVFRIEGSGISNQEYRFCLQSHFDFLVIDAEDVPSFAVEFDGPQHQNDPAQRKRDLLKNRLCDCFGLPLLRISHNHIIAREGAAFLDYMIDLHFGEKTVPDAVEKGDLTQNEEYFPGTEFPGTTKLCRELHKRGIYPSGWLLLLGEEERANQLWYRVLDQSLDCPTPPQQRPCKASVKIEILEGWRDPVVILSVKRTAILTDCSPNFDVLGVHGWHIALEFAEFLCFQELVRKIDNLPHS